MIKYSVAPRYKLTVKMRAYILRHGSNWTLFELTQDQCAKVGLLPSRGYYYNTAVQRCGDVIKFTQNTLEDSSVNIRYSFVPK